MHLSLKLRFLPLLLALEPACSSPEGPSREATSAGSPSGGVTGSGGSKGTGAPAGGASNSNGAGGSPGNLNPGGTGASPSTGGSGSGAGGAPGDGSGGSSQAIGFTAQVASEQMGRGVNLGQMFESTQHPRSLQAAQAKIDAYYDRGFRNLRIPITWTERIGGDLLVKDASTGEVDRSHPRLAVIESVVDYALSKPELIVVINAHHEVRLKTESRSSVLQQLWKDIAEIFADRDYRLLFEILNEPHRADESAMPAEDLREMTSLAYAKIREIDAERIILFGGNQWFGAHEIPEVWTDLEGIGEGNDPYLMAEFHHYDPWEFCGDNQGSYDDPWTDAHQYDPMKLMADWAESVGKGMPVYIGEWGVGWGSAYSTMDCNNIRKWYEDFHGSHAKDLGQPTAVWDDGGWFKIFDHSTNDFNNNLIDCISGECSWSGTERFNGACQ